MTEVQSVTIAHQRAAGATYRELAALYDTSKTSIYRVLTKPEIQEVIESEIQEQIKLLPKANQILTKQLDSATEAIAQGAVKIVYQNTGVTPSHTPSTILVRMTQINNNIQLSSRLSKALELVDSQGTLPSDAKLIMEQDDNNVIDIGADNAC